MSKDTLPAPVVTDEMIRAAEHAHDIARQFGKYEGQTQGFVRKAIPDMLRAALMVNRKANTVSLIAAMDCCGVQLAPGSTSSTIDSYGEFKVGMTVTRKVTQEEYPFKWFGTIEKFRFSGDPEMEVTEPMAQCFAPLYGGRGTWKLSSLVPYDQEWHSGPPPSLGWWPASVDKNPDVLRWWNGKYWSNFAMRGNEYPEERASKQANVGSEPIYWKHRPLDWPDASYT